MFSFFSLEIGKTSVSVALAHIFGFGHTQSDDVQLKNNKRAVEVFIKNVVKLLNKDNVVIADKYILFLYPLIFAQTTLIIDATTSSKTVYLFEMRLNISPYPSIFLL